MRKFIKAVCLLIPLVFLFGVAKGEGNYQIASVSSNKQVTTERVDAYFPIKKDVRYFYEGSGNEYATYDVYNDYTSASKVQQRIDNGGTVVARVVQVADGKVTIKYLRAEAYYRENFLNAVSNKSEILLKEPLKVGTSWKLSDSRVRSITGTSVSVKTPSGTYKTIRVETKGKHDKTIDYYAKNVGLVKSVFISGDTEITSTLSKIEKNAPFVQQVKFFYPNIDDGELYYEDKEISFKTNDITRITLEKAYKNLSSEGGKVFSKNTKINSLYLNKDGMVYIDLNKAFLTEMNAGAAYESMILQSIANTFGNYYGAQKVILTIDNKLYESGHILLKKGESLKVNYDNVVELK